MYLYKVKNITEIYYEKIFLFFSDFNENENNSLIIQDTFIIFTFYNDIKYMKLLFDVLGDIF